MLDDKKSKFTRDPVRIFMYQYVNNFYCLHKCFVFTKLFLICVHFLLSLLHMFFIIFFCNYYW